MTVPTAEPARAADLCFACRRAKALDATRRHDLDLPGVTSHSAPPADGWIAAFR